MKDNTEMVNIFILEKEYKKDSRLKDATRGKQKQANFGMAEKTSQSFLSGTISS